MKVLILVWLTLLICSCAHTDKQLSIIKPEDSLAMYNNVLSYVRNHATDTSFFQLYSVTIIDTITVMKSLKNTIRECRRDMMPFEYEGKVTMKTDTMSEHSMIERCQFLMDSIQNSPVKDSITSYVATASCRIRSKVGFIEHKNIYVFFNNNLNVESADQSILPITIGCQYGGGILFKPTKIPKAEFQDRYL